MTRYTHVKCQSSGTHSFKNRQLTRLKFSKIAQTHMVKNIGIHRKVLYGRILLSRTCKLNYANIHNYGNMRLMS